MRAPATNQLHDRALRDSNPRARSHFQGRQEKPPAIGDGRSLAPRLGVASRRGRPYPRAMRPALALTFLLLCTHARAACTPASALAIAEADRAASEAGRKADQAESVAVRSGNPGAARRAEQARREAEESRRRADELACKATPAAKPRPVRLPGY